jgi:hypothetical protein
LARQNPHHWAGSRFTFTLSGYHNVDLRRAIDNALPRRTVLTQWFSGRQRFADAYFRFANEGTMAWNITPEVLTLNGVVELKSFVEVVPRGAIRLTRKTQNATRCSVVPQHAFASHQ